MKRKGRAILGAFLILFPGFVQSQPANSNPGGRPEALTIPYLEMSTDHVREDQRFRFVQTLLKLTYFSGRSILFVKDRDEIVAEARGVLLRPVDLAREFCVQRAYGGRTLSQVSIGPFLVEDLEMVPDPARLGQEVCFNLRLRNSGIPVRANIRIEDGDEIVSWVDNVSVEPGIGEYRFPHTGFSLQKLDHCFSIMIEVDGKLYKAETTRELCVKPRGCCPR